MPLVVALLAGLAACGHNDGGAGGTPGPSSASSSSARSSAPTSAPASARPSRTPTSAPPPSTPLRTVTVGPTVSGATYVITIWAQRRDATCAEHAYGAPVVDFLRAHRCNGLTRLLATTTVDGRGVGFAESRLGFTGTADAVYRVAGDFRRLVTLAGTGNIVDLLREGGRLPSGPTSVPVPSAFSALSQDAGVTIDELWYLSGPTPENDPPLVRLAQDIYLQWG